MPHEILLVLCPDCGGFLDLSQPDLSRPLRKLGLCLECRAWWLLSFGPDPLVAPILTRIDVDASDAESSASGSPATLPRR
jgi:hypothetical protein